MLLLLLLGAWVYIIFSRLAVWGPYFGVGSF